LSRLKQPRFEQALGLINNALKIIPGNPRFLETRGNIYLKMKQYELAFHDFETAEVQVKDNKSLYQNLLFLSQELGFDDLYRRKYEKRLADLAAGEVSAD
jgi:tetratricopeptide (TPR) repeat protein